MLTKSKPEQAKLLLKQAQEDVLIRWKLYEHMAGVQQGPVEKAGEKRPNAE
jgi:pyruvate-ferredoxin/flavodoxin oxidoreductase